MASLKENFDKIVNSLDEKATALGFSKAESGNENEVAYEGEKGAIRFVCEDGKFSVYTGDSIDEANTRLCASLFDDNSDDKDVRFIVSETAESLQTKFDKKAPTTRKPSQKGPQTVSKTAVKHGSFYDANTLASKLCIVFPDLRPAYKEHLAAYEGDFLGEEFFMTYGTKYVIDAIKENNPHTMKKMFQILNEIYEDGTNDTQSLIAVTILGELNNDQILLARCVDYMSETMAPPVIEVNKYLASAAGKKAKKNLLNPPAYKPKKQKKPGMFAQAMAQGGGMQPPIA